MGADSLSGNTSGYILGSYILKRVFHLLKWILISTGALSVFTGALTFWLPIPIGLPLILLGTALLVRHSPHARLWIYAFSRRIPGLRQVLRRVRPANEGKNS